MSRDMRSCPCLLSSPFRSFHCHHHCRAGGYVMDFSENQLAGRAFSSHHHSPFVTVLFSPSIGAHSPHTHASRNVSNGSLSSCGRRAPQSNGPVPTAPHCAAPSGPRSTPTHVKGGLQPRVNACKTTSSEAQECTRTGRSLRGIGRLTAPCAAQNARTHSTRGHDTKEVVSTEINSKWV